MKCPTRLRGDRGAASSLTTVLLTPVFVVLCFAAFQAAMWSHARTEARVVARNAAAQVARADVAATVAERSAAATLAADTDLRDVTITITETGRLVTVTVEGAAPGIVRGTASRVAVTAAVPVEGWVP